MKFICNQQILAKSLNTVSKAISTRTTIPILKGVMITSTDSNHLTIAASDNDISISNIIEADIQQPGSIVITAKLFTEIIRKLPNEDILIEEDANRNIIIKSSSSEFQIMGLPVDEYPNMLEEDDTTNEIIFNKAMLSRMIKMTSFAASNEEAKGIIVGILMEMFGGNLTLAALDGFRMAIARETIPNGEYKNIIIAAKLITEINRILIESDSEDDILIKLGVKKAAIIVDNTKIVVRLMDGDFINYKAILPSECNTEIIVNRNDIINSIERASLLAKEGNNKLIKMSIDENVLEIYSKSEEGNVHEELIVEKNGENLEIGFNSKYILDVIKTIEDETIKMEFTSSVSPSMIKPVSGNSFEYLVLPVRLSSN